MRIGTNVAALTTHRVLERSDRAVSESLQRLSSGARINHAADDAGGLSVSEGLRSRSTGMRQAVRNIRDGIDLVRTAESALATTTSVLQRMRDLSVQAANDGGLDDAAQGAIRRELDQLSRELTRIARTTTYNGTPLLDGSYRGTLQVGAEAGETIIVAIGDLGRGVDAASLGVDVLDVRPAVGAGVLAAGVMAAGGGVTVRVTPARSAAEGGPAAGSIALAGDFATAATFTGLAGTIAYGGRTLDLATVDYQGAVTADQHLRELEKAIDDAFGIKKKDVIVGPGQLVITGDEPGNASTAADAQQLTPTYTAPPPIPAPPTTPTPPVVVADDPLHTIDEAIARVSATRAGLGAIENRLEYTVTRLGAAFENTTTAFSRIRDTDMAREMTALTRNLTLVRAGSAMLAQANQTSQGVLRLLS
ncbi:flagellin N-terminal helical domain-containing protein [Geodermatophilus sp. URMC 64]